MNKQEALSILMMSPFYFKLPLSARKSLLEEFCRNLPGLPTVHAGPVSGIKKRR